MDPIEQYERASALKHDLGKYVAWISSNFPDEAWAAPLDEELLAALRSDVLETRKPHHGPPEAAWDVWEKLTDGIPRPFVEPELRAVALAVTQLRRAEQPLRSADRDGVSALSAEVRAAQHEIRAQLRAYHRRLAKALR